MGVAPGHVVGVDVNADAESGVVFPAPAAEFQPENVGKRSPQDHIRASGPFNKQKSSQGHPRKSCFSDRVGRLGGVTKRAAACRKETWLVRVLVSQKGKEVNDVSFTVEVGWSVSFENLIQFKHGVPLERGCLVTSLCHLVRVNNSESLRRGCVPLFRRCDGHSWKIGFMTFVVCMWEERADLRLVGLFP